MKIAFVGPAIVRRLFTPALEALRGSGHDTQLFDGAEAFLAADISGLDVLVALPNFAIDGALMDRAPGLRAIVSPVTGTEGIDQQAASERGILVVNGQIEENYTGMGEAAVLLILASLYDLHATERVLRENLPRPAHLTARQLMGKTVGIIGFGRMGQVIAMRLSTWKARLLVTVQTERPLPGHVEAAPLERLLAESDVVVVASALTAKTRGMLGLDRLRLMKPDAVFLSLSRGGIASDTDLDRIARERPAMKLALDVYDKEPLAPDSPLRTLPNAILTPHMVGHTVETHERLPVVLIENIQAVLEGAVPPYTCNKQIAETWTRRWRGEG